MEVITLSGSGEPTLALNLGEILQMAKQMTGRPTVVLTNGLLLGDAGVRADLAIADQIAIKIDAVTPDLLQRVNRPVQSLDLDQHWRDLEEFRQQYQGTLAIQTMLLSPWSESDQRAYIALMQRLAADEIQLNTPTRPKPLQHQLEARGNHPPEEPSYPTRLLKPVEPEVLQDFGDHIQAATGIPVRYPQVFKK